MCAFCFGEGGIVNNSNKDVFLLECVALIYQNILYSLIIVTLIICAGANQNKAYAASQDECAIWLCLPGGFPAGCSAAHSAMFKRLKKRKPPLPSFGSCATEGSGRYKMGYEYFEPCKEDYGLKYLHESEYESNKKANCINMTPKCVSWRERWAGNGIGCEEYRAIRRPKPNFVEMWANGEYIGKFFYQ